MSTGGNTSSTYARSSFDAMETTRRLSDGISGHRGHLHLPNGVRETRQDSNDTTIPDGSNTVIIKDQNESSSQDSNQTQNGSQKESSTSIDDCYTSCSLGSVAKEKTSDESEYKFNANDNGDGYGHFNDTNNVDADDETVGEDEIINVDQRSQSDSDLESPDDFDADGLNQYESFEQTENSETTRKSPGTTLRKEVGGDQRSVQGFDLTNRIIAKSNIITSSDIENHGNYHFKSKHQENSYQQNTNDEEKSDTNEYKEEEDFKLHSPRLNTSTANSDDPYQKIHDNADVVSDIEKMDEVKDIGFYNMEKLQHLDRSDPALRRLFLRPRVTPAETKSVKVDPDIKSMVNEFLKTNVADNFIIARVLRENYALFYAWLASHMQTERNAWAVRLGQALEKAEMERKESLESRNLVVEAATRLRTLVTTVSDSLYGMKHDNRSKHHQVFAKAPSLRHGHVKGFLNSKGGGGVKPSKSNENRNNNDKKSKDNNNDNNNNNNINDDHTYKSTQNLRHYNSERDGKDFATGASSMLRQSSFNVIQVCQPDNYESDPGTGKYAHNLRKKHMHHNMNNSKNNININNKNNNMKSNGSLDYDNRNMKCNNSYSQSFRPDVEPVPFGYSVNGVMVHYDDETDWNQVLTDCIDVLTEICDTFLTDRKACLRLVCSKSSQYESLVDALSTFIQDNQSRDFFMRKEIEKRLRVLEVENKNMQEEVSVLKKTLLDKNEDALSLQAHLNRLEAAVKSQRAETADKCVGTKWEELASPRINLAVLKHGKGVKSNSPRFEGTGEKQKGAKIKSNKSHKIIKSPYATQDPPVVNGTAPTKPVLNTTKIDVKNGYVSDVSESTASDNGCRTSQQLETEAPLGVHRQQSFIEISEEKLEKLKHRAKKLEDSLHEAINSMDALNKSTPWTDRSRNVLERPAPRAHIQKVKAAGNHYQTVKSIAYWKRSTFDTGSHIPNRKRFIGTISKPGFESYRKTKDFNNGDLEISLKSENSSLLEGRSIGDNLWNDNNTVSSLKLMPDRSQELTPHSTVSRLDGYQSDDDDDVKTRGRQQHQQVPHHDLSARSEVSHKVRARRVQAKQAVSKCLRCQKLFSPVDNHKLACCYHIKEKERLEHYDHMGMLVKVIYAWKCCHQPQEADGCSFGKHV